jgi:hypothetical protein
MIENANCIHTFGLSSHSGSVFIVTFLLLIGGDIGSVLMGLLVLKLDEIL